MLGACASGGLTSTRMAASLSFTAIGITYFIRTRAAFSLWATFALVNVVDVERKVTVALRRERAQAHEPGVEQEVECE